MPPEATPINGGLTTDYTGPIDKSPLETFDPTQYNMVPYFKYHKLPPSGAVYPPNQSKFQNEENTPKGPNIAVGRVWRLERKKLEDKYAPAAYLWMEDPAYVWMEQWLQANPPAGEVANENV